MATDNEIIPNITTNEDFQKLAAGSIAVLHFWAPWAEACNQMNGVLSELAKGNEYPNLKFLKIEAESVPEVSLRYNIIAVPTFIFVKNFEQFDRIDGAHAAELTKKVRHYNANPQSIVPKEVSQPANEHIVPPANVSEPQPQEETKEVLQERLKKLTHSHPCMIFMKGDANQPRCGFSKQLIGLLNEQNADFKTFDILSDENVRQGLKEYSNWPTYPQVYINGELIGGLDIVKELIESGELADKLPKKSSLDEKLKQLVNKAPVMVFMKGSAAEPRCGFSRTLMQILSETGTKFDTFDILQDEEVRQGLKTYSNWPTFPQVYVKGQLIGGLDIVKELKESGELESTLLGQ